MSDAAPAPDLDAFIAQELAVLETAGPRLTGSAAHRRLVERVAGQLADAGLDVHTDRHTFTRWQVRDEPGSLSLTVAGESVAVSSAYPYSGCTGRSGVRGRLHHLSGLFPRWRSARGGIAVVEIPDLEIPADVLVREWDPGEPVPDQRNPVLAATILGPRLQAARRAGVAGVVIAWRGVSAENAAGQYLPFVWPYRDIPAVFVAGDAAEAVLAGASREVDATLVVDADLEPGCHTDTVYAVAKGSTDESVVVVSHSDGINIVEENGHIALVALARDAVARDLERTVLFVLTTGHLRIPAITTERHAQATTAWFESHPELWKGGPGRLRAVAALGLEHFGAVEHVDDPVAGTCAPSGALEQELLLATTPELADLAADEWIGAEPGETRVVAPGPFVHFGEGEPAYDQAIPGVSLVTAPQYLLAARTGDLVDRDAACRQIDSFRRILVRFDRLSGDAFGRVEMPSGIDRARGAVTATRAVIEALVRSRLGRRMQVS